MLISYLNVMSQEKSLDFFVLSKMYNRHGTTVADIAVNSVNDTTTNALKLFVILMKIMMEFSL